LGKKKQKKAIKKLIKLGVISSDSLNSSCCKNYKKGKNKRCAKCPCYDLDKKNQALDALVSAKRDLAV
jgi:hypothetical protein